MALDSASVHTRQDELHVPNDINALAALFASGVSSDASKPVKQLSLSPPRRAAHAISRKPKNRAAPMGKPVQLGVRVKSRTKDAMRDAAARRDISLAAAVEMALCEWLRRQRQ